MPIRDTLLLALEAIYGNRLRAGLTMLGMIIGVGAVVLLVSIGNGAKNYITGEFEGMGSNIIIIQPGRTDKKMGMGPPVGNTKEKLTLGDVQALDQQSFNLEAVSGMMFGPATVKHNESTLNINVLGVNEQLPQIFNIRVRTGEFITADEDATGRRVVILGYGSKQNLFGDGDALGQMVKINNSEHRVTGVLEKAGETLGFNMDDMAIIPTRSAMRIFNADRLFGIRARAKSRSGVDVAVEEIKSLIRERHNGQENFTVVTQYSMLQTMNTILGMLTYVLAGIAMISMIVGGIGIMNIMLVSVTERTREIGVRRAVGARQSDVLKQFLAEAVALSLIGGLIGLAGSAFLTYVVYWSIPKFDMRAPAWVMLPAFALSCLIGIGFGVWPARKAARIETIDALRFE